MVLNFSGSSTTLKVQALIIASIYIAASLTLQTELNSPRVSAYLKDFQGVDIHSLVLICSFVGLTTLQLVFIALGLPRFDGRVRKWVNIAVFITQLLIVGLMLAGALVQTLATKDVMLATAAVHRKTEDKEVVINVTTVVHWWERVLCSVLVLLSASLEFFATCRMFSILTQDVPDAMSPPYYIKPDENERIFSVNIDELMEYLKAEHPAQVRIHVPTTTAANLNASTMESSSNLVNQSSRSRLNEEFRDKLSKNQLLTPEPKRSTRIV